MQACLILYSFATIAWALCECDTLVCAPCDVLSFQIVENERMSEEGAMISPQKDCLRVSFTRVPVQ